MSKCARILALRWAVLVAILGQLVCAVLWAVNGDMPVRDTFMLFVGQNEPLPWALPYWVDPLALMLPVAIAIWLLVDYKQIAKWWWKSYDGCEIHEKTSSGIGFGMFVGISGSIIIALGGLMWLAWCAAIGGAYIVICGLCMPWVKPIQSFGCELIAGLTIWGFSTIYQGAIVGFVAAVLCVTIAGLVHLLPYYAILGIYRVFSGDFVSRKAASFAMYMTHCDLEEENC